MYNLKREDINKASQVLAKAFEQDPAWVQVMTEEKYPIKQLSLIFRILLLYTIKYGNVSAYSSALEGMALWLPARYGKMSFWRILRSGGLKAGKEMDRTLSKKMQLVFKGLDEKRTFYTNKEDIYLLILAVDPMHQGKGIGSSLLTSVIREADEKGCAVYLETEPDENVRYYKKFDFEVVDEMPREDYDFRLMLRKCPAENG